MGLTIKLTARVLAVLALASSLLTHSNSILAAESPIRSGQGDGINVFCVDVNLGHDDNNGSSEQPFKTIQAAANKAGPGQQVYIRAGNYHERVVFPRSGSLGRPIVFAGERGRKGELLVHVYGGDPMQGTWRPAPEIGPMVFKTYDIPHDSSVMSIRIGGLTKEITRLNGVFNKVKTQLAMLPEARTRTRNLKYDVAYWDGLEAVHAYDASTGASYIRFRNGDNPNTKELCTSADHVTWDNIKLGTASAFFLDQKEHITIRGLEINGGQQAILIRGEKSAHNIIEDNHIVNAPLGVSIVEGAHNNHIRKNKIYRRILSNTFHLSAWQQAESVFTSTDDETAYAYGVAEHMDAVREVTVKAELAMGTAAISLATAGTENHIKGNHIYEMRNGVQGSCDGEVYIYDNDFEHISSTAIIIDIGSMGNYEIYNNSMRNVNCALGVSPVVVSVSGAPVSILESARTAKQIWFYKNTLVNPQGVGTHINCEDSAGQQEQSKEGHPSLYVYHNSFSGAAASRFALTHSNFNVVLLNNVFSGSNVYALGTLGIVDYNWFGNGRSSIRSSSSGSNNVEGYAAVMWDSAHEVDFLIPDSNQGDEIRSAGINLSQSFVIDGRKHSAMRGMKSIYYKGSVAAIGAQQATVSKKDPMRYVKERPFVKKHGVGIQGVIASRENPRAYLPNNLTQRSMPDKWQEEFNVAEGESYAIEVKFRDEVAARVGAGGNIITLHKGDPQHLFEIIKAQDVRVKPLHDCDEKIMMSLEKRAAERTGVVPADLKGYISVSIVNTNNEDTIALAQRLRALDMVEYVQLAITSKLPVRVGDIAPVTDNIQQYQTYRAENPGMGIDYAWSLGYKGAGIKVSDLEYSFETQHEDLVDANILVRLPNITNAQAKFDANDHAHGTAVMGVLAAPDNGYGVTGCITESDVGMYSIFDFQQNNALSQAIAESAAGDVIFLEVATGQGYPIDYSNSFWNIVKTGTDAGVLILIPAGNINADLDSSFFATYRSWGDNGSIMVGAGTSDLLHDKLLFSTSGSPVDVQGWGINVVTTGYNAGFVNLGPLQTYTSSFDGTSVATSLVASVVALVQNAAKEELGRPLTPREMRQLLIDSGIPQGAGNHIGPLPDMRAAINLMRSRFGGTGPGNGGGSDQKINGWSTGWGSWSNLNAILDGNLSTSIGAFGIASNNNFAIYRGDIQNISKIRLYQEQTNTLQIQISDDVTADIIHNGAVAGGGWVEFTFPERPVRWIQVYRTGGSASWKIYEIETWRTGGAPATVYALTVNSGSNDGNYAAGATVNIVANAAANGFHFKNWSTSGGGSFASSTAANTTFTMPGHAVTVSAHYEADGGTGGADVKVHGWGHGWGEFANLSPVYDGSLSTAISSGGNANVRSFALWQSNIQQVSKIRIYQQQAHALQILVSDDITSDVVYEGNVAGGQWVEFTFPERPVRWFQVYRTDGTAAWDIFEIEAYKGGSGGGNPGGNPGSGAKVTGWGHGWGQFSNLTPVYDNNVNTSISSGGDANKRSFALWQSNSKSVRKIRIFQQQTQTLQIVVSDDVTTETVHQGTVVGGQWVEFTFPSRQVKWFQVYRTGGTASWDVFEVEAWD